MSRNVFKPETFISCQSILFSYNTSKKPQRNASETNTCKWLKEHKFVYAKTPSFLETLMLYSSTAL